MKKQFPFALGYATFLVVASATSLSAQDPSQVAYTPETSNASRPHNVPASKPHKVWNDDDVSSLRSPADKYLDQKQTQQAAADAAAKAAKPSQTEAPSGPPPALSNPKSVTEADHMIEWENLDIDAQEQFLNKLRDQRRDAAPEDRERIQKLIDQRVGIIAQTKRERDALLAQKQDLAAKAAAGTNSPAPNQAH
jgi:hypothetical protein